MKALRNLIFVTAAIGFSPVKVMACAACYGTSDSPMAQGMNAGVLFLLGVIGMVLCGAATFFVFLARRSSAVAKVNENPPI